jgi:hypothetical protein
MKIRVIDLLNKFANNEKLPKKIEYKKEIFTLYKDTSYINYDTEKFLFDEYFYTIFIEKSLNEEITILED